MQWDVSTRFRCLQTRVCCCHMFVYSRQPLTQLLIAIGTHLVLNEMSVPLFIREIQRWPSLSLAELLLPGRTDKRSML